LGKMKLNVSFFYRNFCGKESGFKSHWFVNFLWSDIKLSEQSQFDIVERVWIF
jgi:hypothetical protein